LPIVANQEPNCRPGDFITSFPCAVVVCTDLPSSAFPDEADENWVVPNVSVTIGTFLGLKTRPEVEELMRRLRDRGLRILVLDQCKTGDILSAEVEKPAEDLVRTVAALSKDGKDAGRFRIVGMLMQDIFKKTGLIRYCWFFEDGRSSRPADAAHPAPKAPRRWWQFWKQNS
jgi:hypothetical protein